MERGLTASTRRWLFEWQAPAGVRVSLDGLSRRAFGRIARERHSVRNVEFQSFCPEGASLIGENEVGQGSTSQS